MIDAFDEIDLGGNVIGVRTVPPERILGDNPIDNVPKPQKEWSSRNACDVLNWDEKTYTLTLSVSPRLSRKILSDTIAEQMSVKRIDRVRVYVRRHPLMNLPIHVLHHCGFHRAGVELCWERSLVPVKSEPVLVKPEPTTETHERWDAWREELRALKSQEEYCRKNRIIWMDRDIERMKWLEEQIATEETFRNSPEMRAIQAEIDALDAMDKS